MTDFEQIVNQPFLYVNGLNIFPSATSLIVNSGRCRDDSNKFDLIVPNAIAVDLTANGLNGLDVGSLAANVTYNVYVIGDSSGFSRPGIIVSLLSAAGVTMPQGASGSLYNLKRRIGYIVTNGSSQVVSFVQSGNNNEKRIQLDTIVAVLTAGTAAAFAAVPLTPAVPNVINLPVLLIGQNSAAGTALVRPTGSASTSPAFRLAGSGLISSPATVLTSGANGSVQPSVDYQVSAGNFTLWAAGWLDSL